MSVQVLVTRQLRKMMQRLFVSHVKSIWRCVSQVLKGVVGGHGSPGVEWRTFMLHMGMGMFMSPCPWWEWSILFGMLARMLEKVDGVRRNGQDVGRMENYRGWSSAPRIEQETG